MYLFWLVGKDGVKSVSLFWLVEYAGVTSVYLLWLVLKDGVHQCASSDWLDRGVTSVYLFWLVGKVCNISVPLLNGWTVFHHCTLYLVQEVFIMGNMEFHYLILFFWRTVTNLLPIYIFYIHYFLYNFSPQSYLRDFCSNFAISWVIFLIALSKQSKYMFWLFLRLCGSSKVDLWTLIYHFLIF